MTLDLLECNTVFISLLGCVMLVMCGRVHVWVNVNDYELAMQLHVFMCVACYLAVGV